jgi:hypothetical protein
MVVETKMGFLFITFFGQSVQCCECCEQSVQSRRGLVQCCPDQHPAMTSMALWDTVQKYPACSADTRFADVLYQPPHFGTAINPRPLTL